MLPRWKLVHHLPRTATTVSMKFTIATPVAVEEDFRATIVEVTVEEEDLAEKVVDVVEEASEVIVVATVDEAASEVVEAATVRSTRPFCLKGFRSLTPPNSFPSPTSCTATVDLERLSDIHRALARHHACSI